MVFSFLDFHFPCGWVQTLWRNDAANTWEPTSVTYATLGNRYDYPDFYANVDHHGYRTHRYAFANLHSYTGQTTEA